MPVVVLEELFDEPLGRVMLVPLDDVPVVPLLKFPLFSTRVGVLLTVEELFVPFDITRSLPV